MAEPYEKRSKGQAEYELSTDLVANKFDARERVTIRLTVVNESTHDVQQGGSWGVKDEDANPPVAQTATFNPIARGQSDTQSVTLPSGFEWGIFRFEAADGSGSWAGVHGGSNNTSGTLRLRS